MFKSYQAIKILTQVLTKNQKLLNKNFLNE